MKKPAAKAAKKSAPKKVVVKSKPAAKIAASKAKPAAKISSSKAPKLTDYADFTPLDDRVVVEVAEAAEKTLGGIIIPGNVASRPNSGIVISVGRGRRSKKGTIRPMDVKVGDSVVFAEFAGTKAELSGKDVVLLREEEILGVLD